MEAPIQLINARLCNHYRVDDTQHTCISRIERSAAIWLQPGGLSLQVSVPGRGGPHAWVRVTASITSLAGARMYRSQSNILVSTCEELMFESLGGAREREHFHCVALGPRDSVADDDALIVHSGDTLMLTAHQLRGSARAGDLRPTGFVQTYRCLLLIAARPGARLALAS